MSWQDKYDKINATFDGDIFVFGGHYSTEEVRKIIEDESWDEPSEWAVKDSPYAHVWLRFMIVWPEGEGGPKTHGWTVLGAEPKNKRGCIKATEIVRVEK